MGAECCTTGNQNAVEPFRLKHKRVKERAKQVFEKHNHVAERDKPMLRMREKKFVHDICFSSRPLGIIVTSSINKMDGYLTGFTEDCVIKDEIVLNSKLICVDGKSVEGLEIRDIAMCLLKVEVPCQLTLVKPGGLNADEVPDVEPITPIKDKRKTNL